MNFAHPLLSLTLVCLCMSTLSCLQEPSPESARTLWLHQMLLDDNRNLLEREPALTAGKFAKMASTPYNYFRGTANIFLRDATEPGGLEPATKYGSADASHILLVGDPHPENIGTYRNASGDMVVDFNDFDASTFGPYHLDVRRLAVGFGLVATLAQDNLSDATRDAIPRALTTAYVEEITRIATGQEGFMLRMKPGQYAEAGAIISGLLTRAERDGGIREELVEYTERVGEGRQVRYGVIEAPEVEGVYRDMVQEVTPRQKASVEAFLARYPDSLLEQHPLKHQPGAFRLKGIARRLGAGVSSYPVRRYYVLVEGATTSPDDDVLLEFKEILEAWRPTNLPAFRYRRYASDAERVVTHQRRLQTAQDNDIWLGWAARGPYSVRVRERSKYQKGVDVERILEELETGALQEGDLLALATRAGRLLARAHGDAPTLEEKQGAVVIHEALSFDPQNFIDETIFTSHHGVQRTLKDYERFQALLERHGPHLGYVFGPIPSKTQESP